MGKIIMLSQDKTELAAEGDIVVNLGTTGCGLVLAFDETSDKVACYHWPGLEAELMAHQETFRNLCRDKCVTVSKIIILTNDFFDLEMQQQYQAAGRVIRDMYHAETHYYYRTEHLNGDPMLQLGTEKTPLFIEQGVVYSELRL